MPSSTTPSPQPQTPQIPLTCSGHTRPVVQLAFSGFISGSNSNYMLISACKDGKPILRNGPTGDWLGTFVGHKGAVWSAMLNAATTRAVTASADYTAKVWNAITGQELVTLAHKHIVKTADFAAGDNGDDDEGNAVVTGGQDKAVRLFDVARPDAPTVVATHDAPLRNVKWSAHRRLVLSAADDRCINAIDVRAPPAAAVVASLAAPAPIANISLTGDGRLLSCAAGNRVVVWDTDALGVVKDFAVDYEVSVAAINPQRSRIVAGAKSDLLIRVIDYDSGALVDTHKGHHGPVHDACFNPDGHVYATGSEDGTVRLWQTNPGTVYGLWQPRAL
ncbi:hypothetical protein H4217_002093 [Coemansia sp. RSA 1939]|nr:hypothetical protein H4217_002093 [Coemansia sp. RSA 1939]KAJ2612325.1 hypothetical protein EV177_003047 [Coemansia sp. RSA 1804]